MSFRKYGGLQYNAKHNIVSSNYNTSNNLLVTEIVGQPNSYIVFESDISGNIIIYGDLDVSGNGIFSGTVTATNIANSSDYRIKENVESLDEKYVVDNLNPVTYKNIKTNKQDIGLIAHELQEVFPDLVNGVKDGEELQSVNYMGLIPVLIKEIKELKKEMQILKNEMKTLY